MTFMGSAPAICLELDFKTSLENFSNEYEGFYEKCIKYKYVRKVSKKEQFIMTNKLIANWQKKNHQLSQLMIDSLVGLDIWETLLVLGRLRREDDESEKITIHA